MRVCVHIGVRIAALIAVLATGCRSEPVAGTIYFVSEASGHPKTYVVGADGSGLRALFADDPRPDYPYGASVDRRAIAIVRGEDGENDIMLVTPDGSAPRVIAGDAGIDGSPSFSPDGQWILFESARDAFRELYRLPFGGGGAAERLTNDREGNFDGAWSPDSKRIAFASSRHGRLDLFVMNADGTDQRRLTSHPGDSIKPAWSRDGAWIAFVSGRDGQDGLYVIRPDGSDLTKLSGSTRVEERFAWRPDGGALAYSATDSSGKKKLHLVTIAGADRALSGPEHDDCDAAWSPDGAHLAFASQEKRGHPDIWIMRADGSARTRITRDAKGAWLPRWY